LALQIAGMKFGVDPCNLPFLQGPHNSSGRPDWCRRHVPSGARPGSTELLTPTLHAGECWIEWLAGKSCNRQAVPKTGTKRDRRTGSGEK
jgi:hypothetical protein